MLPDKPEGRTLARFRRLAELLDARFRIPGTSIRFGWDAILGLLPGVGDAAGGLAGGYGLFVAWRLGAPGTVLGRMALNLGLDLLVGAIPFLGDLFDLGWRGNLRNLALLERWLAAPHTTTRRSGALLAAVAAGLVLTLVAAGAFLVWLLREVAARL